MVRILRQRLRLYLVTDRRLAAKIGKTIFEVAQEACPAGVTALQYREKEMPLAKQLIEAKKLREITKKYGVLFIVNDDPALAKAARADGVHLGQDDSSILHARIILGKTKLVGVTAHSVEEAVAAEKAGADYVAVSPIFQTSTKKDAGKPAGVELVSRVKAAVNVPVVGIGGINSGNLSTVFKAGADGAAMASEFVKGKDIGKTVAGLKRICCAP